MNEKYRELVNKAKTAHNKNNLSDAIDLYEEAFTLMVVVEDLVDLAGVYLENNMPAKARTAFESIVDVFPALPQGHYGLGLCHEQLGKTDLARDAYLKAIKFDPSYAQAYFNLALLAEDAGNEQKAYDYYKKTLLYNSGHFWANLNLGSFYERKELNEIALEHTLKAYKMNKDEKMVTYNLGVIYAKLNNFADAVKYYKEELKKPQCFKKAYLNLALIYKDVYADYEKSKFYLLEGISRFKDYTDLWYNLGCIYALMHDYDNAENCLYYAVVKGENTREAIESDEELREFRTKGYYRKLLERLN